FDVTDRSAPGVVRETYLDGSYVSSRSIDNRVYVVVRNDLSQVLVPQTPPDGGGGYAYETDAGYRARPRARPLAQLAPPFRTTGPDAAGVRHEQAGAVSAPQDTYRTGASGDADLLSVVVFDVAGDGRPVGSVTVEASYGTVVYASADNFYLLSS